MNTFFALLHGNRYHYFEWLHDMAVCWCSSIKNYFDNIGYLIIWPQVFVLIGDNNWWWGGAGCYTFDHCLTHIYPQPAGLPGQWLFTYMLLFPLSLFSWTYIQGCNWRVWRSPRHRKGCRKGFLGSSSPKLSSSLWPFTFGYRDFS